MRFAPFDQPGHHPMLAMGNEKSRFSFWDLQRLEESDYIPRKHNRHAVVAATAAGRKRGRGSRANVPSVSGRSSTVLSSDARNHSETPDGSSITFAPRIVYTPNDDVSDAFRPIKPHQTVTCQKYNFSTRQMAWSNCGRWCIGVGDFAVMCILKRWDQQDVK